VLRFGPTMLDTYWTSTRFGMDPMRRNIWPGAC